jgi:hypothetical protein
MIGITVKIVTVSLVSILSGYGNTAVAQIRQNLASTGTNATGKTSRSLRFEVKEQGDKTYLKILGKPYIAVVETGRKATPQYTKPSKSFVDEIREWTKARGINPNAAYAIAKSIHHKGTPPTGKKIISNVINDDLVSRISKSILDTFAKFYATNIITQYGRNGN